MTTPSVKSIMSSKVEWVQPSTSLDKIAQTMKERDVGCVLVGENDKLIGIVTDRDIALRAIAAAKHPAQTTAKDIMTKGVLYCKETDTVDAAAANMAKNLVRRLVVLDDKKRLVGIISLGDLATVKATQTALGSALGDICRPSPKKAA